MNFAFLLLPLLQLSGAALASSCHFEEGDYRLDWDVEGPTIHFALTYKNVRPNQKVWTGVAFGESMESGLDSLIVKLIGGEVTVTDEFVRDYGPSWRDRMDDLHVQEAEYKNGVIHAKFSRPIQTVDVDADRDLSGCTTWQFVSAISEVHGANHHTGKHKRTPTGRTICLDKCGQ